MLHLGANLSTARTWTILALYGILFCALRIPQKLIFGFTLGERLWDLRASSHLTGSIFERAGHWKTWLAPKMVQRSSVSSATLGVGTFLTLVAILLGGWAGYAIIALDPLGTAADRKDWQAFLPPLAETGSAPLAKSEQFTIIPFYYTLGAWPRTYQGRSVFYNFPYEKGPPERFAGQIQARWQSPEVRVTFEGPKTPTRISKAGEQGPYSRPEIERCVTEFWSSLSTAWGCLPLRDAVLSRHLTAMKALGTGRDVELSWVRVTNRALQTEEEVQGFYLSGHGSTRGEDRFVMITSRGTHQTFVLDYPLGPTGEHAREVFQNSIRSLRVSDDLNPGKAWVDQALLKVRLDELTKPGATVNPENLVDRLAEIQAMLIARISTDPKMYDTYYHLGGTALLLLRHATKTKAAELSIVARPLVQSALKYAQDIAPKDPRTLQLQQYWNEAQKL